tara:strand:+ start:1033 stop:2043 length:1011 start_codon:yes stop_codon:yes gene_type:complete
MSKTFLITGGSGFIGSNMVKYLLNKGQIIVIDKAKPVNQKYKNYKNVKFYLLDINNDKRIFKILKKHKPDFIINFAAESHVDKSIENPKGFAESNINGTLSLIISLKKYIHIFKRKIKFIQISTDEVYGDIREGNISKEKDNIAPSSPYSASKASADIIINSFIRTYKFPGIILRLCNNYGFYQNPEKLIPKIILKIINNKNIPIYGDGKNKREWIFINDTCEYIYRALFKCKIGETYNIGSNFIKTNYEVANLILKIFREKLNFKKIKSKIIFVKDRPGHDRRYCLNSNKIKKLFKIKNTKLLDGLVKTCKWYIQNKKIATQLNYDYEKRFGLLK